jgi:hypothetical protein
MYYAARTCRKHTHTCCDRDRDRDRDRDTVTVAHTSTVVLVDNLNPISYRRVTQSLDPSLVTELLTVVTVTVTVTRSRDIYFSNAS